MKIEISGNSHSGKTRRLVELFDMNKNDSVFITNEETTEYIMSLCSNQNDKCTKSIKSINQSENIIDYIPDSEIVDIFVDGIISDDVILKLRELYNDVYYTKQEMKYRSSNNV